MRPSRSLHRLAVVSLVMVTACDGGNDDEPGQAGSEALPDDGSSSTDTGDEGPGGPTGDGASEGGDGRGRIPDVDPCSLAADTIRGLFLEISSIIEPTAERTTETLGTDHPLCTWTSTASGWEFTVAVSSYDDAYFDEDVQQAIDPTPVPGLGDEAYITEHLTGVRLVWRRDDFSVELASGFPREEVVAIAHEIDSQMPG